MPTKGCKPNGSGGHQPFDEDGKYASGNDCGGGDVPSQNDGLLFPHFDLRGEEAAQLQALMRGEPMNLYHPPLHIRPPSGASETYDEPPSFTLTSTANSFPSKNPKWDPDSTLTPEQEKFREAMKATNPEFADRPVFAFPQSPGILTFDGKELAYWENGKKVKSWNAVSGRPGFQSKEQQNVEKMGPIPEGVWNVYQERFQNIKDISSIDKISTALSYIPGFNPGPWPGGKVAWGSQREWLEPAKGTNTYGRNNFSIHGGAFPGSAGCIDLTDKMPDFARWLRTHGKDLGLLVRY